MAAALSNKQHGLKSTKQLELTNLPFCICQGQFEPFPERLNEVYVITKKALRAQFLSCPSTPPENVNMANFRLENSSNVMCPHSARGNYLWQKCVNTPLKGRIKFTLSSSSKKPSDHSLKALNSECFLSTLKYI